MFIGKNIDMTISSVESESENRILHHAYFQGIAFANMPWNMPSNFEWSFNIDSVSWVKSVTLFETTVIVLLHSEITDFNKDK